jgi:hypothetical protein
LKLAQGGEQELAGMVYSIDVWLIWAERIGIPISYDAYYYFGLALLVVTMVIALSAAHRVWTEIHDVEDPDTPADLLESFEQAQREGALDRHELDRIRQNLGVSSTCAPAPTRTGQVARDAGRMPDSPAGNESSC